jgi:Amt family ammonium transporter
MKTLAFLCGAILAAPLMAEEIKFENVSGGNTAWVMISMILVLFMTLPGLALFYAGMVRKKNILATMMQSLIAVAVVSVVWCLVGYSLAFGEGGAFLGDLSRAAFGGMILDSGLETVSVHQNAPDVPEPAFAAFQMTFAIISAAIITGSFAGRVKFSALCIFIALWSICVYSPVCHWVWSSNGWLAGDGVLDYAGGTVVHINAGVAGLVGALMLGRRLGYEKEAMPPHNLTLTLVGAAFLWIGWLGFNAGSALAADARAGMAILVTQIAAAAGALAWIIFEAFHSHKPSALGFASGAVSGLVGITPAAGFVNPSGALAIGFLTAVVCFYFVTQIKHRLGYDDSLDAFGIHGVGGMVGAVLTAIFCDAAIGGVEASVRAQVFSVLVTIAYSAAASWAILRLCDAVIGLRVGKEEEREGLDLVCHGERLG